MNKKTLAHILYGVQCGFYFLASVYMNDGKKIALFEERMKQEFKAAVEACNYSE